MRPPACSMQVEWRRQVGVTARRSRGLALPPTEFTLAKQIFRISETLWCRFVAMSAKQEASTQPVPQLPFANDGSFMDLWVKMQAAQNGQHADEAPQEGSSAGCDEPASTGFIPASTFRGPRLGHVFKNSTQGLGYYVDSPPPVAVAQPSKQARAGTGAVILKRKPIINVQRRVDSRTELPAKKGKTGMCWCRTVAAI
jgi:hypothetical protein